MQKELPRDIADRVQKAVRKTRKERQTGTRINPLAVLKYSAKYGVSPRLIERIILKV